MKRIGLLIVLGTAVACGGGIDQSTDSAQNMAQPTPDTSRSAISTTVGERGVCQYSPVTQKLTGTCLEPSFCDFWQRSNPDCVGQLPRGPFTFTRNCGGVAYIATGNRCNERVPAASVTQ
ncbi:MAG TPA: hypothetical protein VII08_09235 [Myxococcales bacterium]